ncbi:hypothetical protein VTI74DRAFT_3279 [Chaetomium olivicolor]
MGQALVFGSITSYSLAKVPEQDRRAQVNHTTTRLLSSPAEISPRPTGLLSAVLSEVVARTGSRLPRDEKGRLSRFTLVLL